MRTKYEQTLEYMYKKLPMYQRKGATAFKKNLDNIIKLCSLLGNPQDNLQCIHIGGTNGKGSTTHILSALLQSQGYRVGVYTSPHYVDFRERIKINQELISKQAVVDFIHNLKADIESIQPSFFEITVAMAFNYFCNQKVDFAIIEVGLGGRLDSTNIIRPVISAITNISLDHVNMLGNTLEAISYEKAGIIKPEIPVMIGETHPTTKPIFEEIAQREHAPIHFSDILVDVVYQQGTATIKTEDHTWTVQVPWWTEYQAHNLKTAVSIFEYLIKKYAFKINISRNQDFLEYMPEKTHFLGRWQWISQSPKILTDSAHNEAGLHYLLKKLAALPYSKIHFVLGFSSDKDLTIIWKHFPKEHKYYWVKANIPRGMDVDYLTKEATKVGFKGKAYTSVRKGLAAAKLSVKPGELIFVGGSIFVVAEVL